MFDLNLINKYRKEIMGFAIIWVMCLHCYAKLTEELHIPVVAFVFSQGNLGVEIFLFLSGIGLYYSMSKDSAPLPFYWRRIKRVVLPWLLLSCPYWIVKTVIADREGLGSFFLNWTGFSFWRDGITTVWYVAFIILLYFLYPVVFRIQQKKSIFLFVMIGVVFLVNFAMLWLCPAYYEKTEIALSRIPIFLLGSYVGALLKNKAWNNRKQVGFAVYTLVLLVLYVLGIISDYYEKNLFSNGFGKLIVRFGGEAIALLIIAALSLLFEKVSLNFIRNGLSSLGEITLEVYLLHVFLGNIVGRVNVVGNRGIAFSFLIQTLVIVVSVIAAKIFAQVYAYLLNKIENRNLSLKG